MNKFGIFVIILIIIGLFGTIKYPLETDKILQKQREQANPEYYILQEIKKDKR